MSSFYLCFNTTHCMKTSTITSKLSAVIAALFSQPPAQEFNFTDYAARHQLAPASINYVTQSRAKTALEPNGYQSNTVRYPSLLTRCNLTGHSRGWEYALDVMLSHDPECEFIIDSPQDLQLEYHSANGKLVKTNYPPDRLVFWRNRKPEIIEVRSCTRLAKLCLEQPERYKEEKPGYFRSPPAEAAAAKLGFSYRILHEKNFTPVYLQNLTFLESYLLHDPTPMPSEVEVTAVLEQVESTPGITLEQITF
jgi:hypothetical protein